MIITHRPAIDWLTLTTPEYKAAARMGEWVKERNLEPLRKGGGGNGYEGTWGDGWFIGEAEKNGKMSYIGRFSGGLADRFMFDRTRPYDVDCTRIDIQLTLPIAKKGEELYEPALTLSQELYAQEKARGPRERNVDPIVPPDGEFTIYLGNRAQSSQRFARLYVKPQEEGDWLLRFEAEFKSKTGLAGKVYRLVGKEPLSMVSILAGELSTWPNHPLTVPFKQYLKHVPQELMKMERTRPTPNTTMRWIVKQVFPAWKRLLGHDDTRDRATALLYELLAFAEGLENE